VLVAAALAEMWKPVRDPADELADLLARGPMTYTDLADASGYSAVHVARLLRRLGGRVERVQTRRGGRWVMGARLT
jgi:DNA-binding IclR family transcriptional regulator